MLILHLANECAFNILSKAFLSSEAAADILDHVVKGSIPLWEKTEKRNLKTF